MSSPIKTIKDSLFLYRAFSLPNMHMPILSSSSEKCSPSKHPGWTNKLLALLDFFPCHRGVKLCLAAVFCLAFLSLALYLNIVAFLVWDSMRRNTLERALPLRHSRNLWQNNETMQIEAKCQRLRQALNASIAQLLEGLPAQDEGWCQRMVKGQLGQEEEAKLAEWKFNETRLQQLPVMKVVEPADKAEAGCKQLRQLFPFPEEPMSEEERQFPLAYGLLVHKSPVQVFALISAIYQPQNAYCIAVDERAEEKFKQAMNLLGDCLPNVFVMSVSKVEWCQFGVVRGVFSCVRYLSELAHPWRYYQYLSGVDLPLKTNLEMVRIFKRLNGTVNAEVLPFEIGRIKGPQMLMKLPMTLWKSSLSALVSREAIDAMVRSEKVRQLMRYLQFGYCQDEALWATMAGNPKELPIPGGFDATYIYGRLFKEAYLSQIQQNEREQSKEFANNSSGRDEFELAEEPFQLATYYISRYQVWRETNLLSGSRNTKCNGTFVSHSCVFGISDLPSLVRRPEMMVHKMYLDFQPAAYFCLWKTIHERALDWRNQQKFQGRIYSELPMVKIARGAAEEELKFFFDL